MKKTFVFFVLGLISFTFFSCPEGIPSPIFAYIEVLDKSGNPVLDCTFTAKYKNEDFTDMLTYFHEYTDEEFEKACKNSTGKDYIQGFQSGKTWYALSSKSFSALVRKIEIEDIYKDISISISKEGYVSQTLDDIQTTKKYLTSLVLEKESE